MIIFLGIAFKRAGEEMNPREAMIKALHLSKKRVLLQIRYLFGRDTPPHTEKRSDRAPTSADKLARVNPISTRAKSYIFRYWENTGECYGHKSDSTVGEHRQKQRNDGEQAKNTIYGTREIILLPIGLICEKIRPVWRGQYNTEIEIGFSWGDSCLQ